MSQNEPGQEIFSTRVSNDGRASVRPWEYEQGRYFNLTDNLRSAMARDPFPRVAFSTVCSND